MAEEKCFACGWVFAPDEPSIVIDDREYCTECATEEAEAGQ